MIEKLFFFHLFIVHDGIIEINRNNRNKKNKVFVAGSMLLDAR